MASATPSSTQPEYNVTGCDFRDRSHFRYNGPPLIDIHAHVMLTPPGDVMEGAPLDAAKMEAGLVQAGLLLDAAEEFGIVQTYTMCSPNDIPALREHFGDRLHFNGFISKKRIDDHDDKAYRLLDRYLELGVEIIKFWSAPRGRERGLFVDAPWRIEAARRARAAGLRIIMVHVADPDRWFQTTYADVDKYGTKPQQYVGLERLLEMFPDLIWIGAHMGGDPEHPDHLEALLERYPHFYLDTSATKWQVREVSPRGEAYRSLICRYPDRFLFGSDLVTHHGLVRDHYVSRYWCQRTLWESSWQGQSPIYDPDYPPSADGPSTPPLLGLALPDDVLVQVYRENARRILRRD